MALGSIALKGDGLLAGRSFVRVLALLSAMSVPGMLVAKPVPESRTVFDAAFDDVFARYQLPGLAVGVIEDGEVVYLRTAGELRAGEGQPVDADTLFKIASNSKAMTTAVMARLVDQGKLRWDDPVTKYLPDFRMHDPWVTEHMQVRDLLIHNSGLGSGAGDMMLWPEPNAFTREDIIAGLAHFKPAYSFRSRYAYDNLLYVVAGEVAASAGGKPFEQLLREELFEPLGLERCQAGAWSRDEVGNVAQPHMRQSDGNVVVREDGPHIPDMPSTAAGGIRCSLNDMVGWMRALLLPDPQQPWLSERQQRELWALHMPMPISRRLREWDGTRMYGYGYGWRISDVDGQWRVAHTGTLMGMYSAVTLLPDSRNGFVILINGEGGEARTVLSQALTRHFTAPGSGADVAYYAGLLAEERRQQRSSVRDPGPDASMRNKVAPAGFADWQGHYRDAWFGEVTICPAGEQVVFQSHKSPRMKGPVSRMDDRWLVVWDDPSVDAPAWLEFGETPDGGMTLSLSHFGEVDTSFNYPDLAFVRTGGCQTP